MRNWIIEEIKNTLNFRNSDNVPYYTSVVGLLFNDEVTYLNSINIQIKALCVGYNLLIFKDNFK